MSEIIAENDRIILKKLEEGDRKFYDEMAREKYDKEYKRLPEKYRNRKDEKEFFWQNMREVNTYSIFLNNGEFCGYINDRMWENEVEVGVELREKYRNKGIYPQAFVLLMNYLYKVKGVSRVVLRIFKSNAHSRHVTEKMGAIYDYEFSAFGQKDLDKIEKKFEGVIEGGELWEAKKKAIDEIMRLIENGAKICKYHFDLPLN